MKSSCSRGFRAIGWGGLGFIRNLGTKNYPGVESDYHLVESDFFSHIPFQKCSDWGRKLHYL